MAYLSKDDYSLRVGVDHLHQILEEATQGTGLSVDQVLSNAEKWARAVVTSYLASQYNIAGEFAKDSIDNDTPPGSDRDFQIVQVTIDLVLCTLCKTINPRNIPEHIQEGCASAAKFLEDARNNLLTITVPPAVPADADDMQFQRTHLESQPKFISKPYQDLSLFDTEQ